MVWPKLHGRFRMVWPKFGILYWDSICSHQNCTVGVFWHTLSIMQENHWKHLFEIEWMWHSIFLVYFCQQNVTYGGINLLKLPTISVKWHSLTVRWCTLIVRWHTMIVRLRRSLIVIWQIWVTDCLWQTQTYCDRQTVFNKGSEEHCFWLPHKIAKILLIVEQPSSTPGM